MRVGHAEAANGVALEVELDQHDRLAADDPAVVARFDRHDLRRFVFHHAAICIFDVDFSVGEESDVGVHAEVGPGNLFHVDRPAEADGVHDALDARRAGTSHVEPDAADLTELGASHGGDERVSRRRRSPVRGLFPAWPGRGFRDLFARALLFDHMSLSCQPRIG
jgi:hypothetical protein